MCSYVVVVEKDAVFQRLVEDGFAEQTGTILVTAKGMPDMATRAFLHFLCTALPHLQQFAGDSRPPATIPIQHSAVIVLGILRCGFLVCWQS